MPEKKEVIISDMSLCCPKTALSNRLKKGHWRQIPYSAEKIEGIFLFAGPETNASEIYLPLELEGIYEIYIGCWGISEFAVNSISFIKVKLSEDPCFVNINLTFNKAIREKFWKIANLTNQNIIFAQHTSGVTYPASIAYVRLVPVSDKTKSIHQEIFKENRRLAAMYDNHGLYCAFRPTTREVIWESLEPLRNTDFGRVYWEFGGMATSKACYSAYQDVENFPRTGDRYLAESISELQSKGIDPIRTAMDYTHEMGMEFHLSERMGAFGLPPPSDEIFSGVFLKSHPELWCRDLDGSILSRPSYAYPETQEYVLSVLKKMVEYKPDGINLLYNRGVPYLLYEKPLVEEFKKQFGEDPCKLHEHDGRWLQFRSEVMTDFMRKVRKMVNESSSSLGCKQMQISVTVPQNKEFDIFYALDIEQWVKERLVDIVMPDANRDDIDMDFFCRITQGTPCLLYPGIKPYPSPLYNQGAWPPETFLEKAIAFYKKGADGLSCWGISGQYYCKCGGWEALRMLGHKEKLKKWLEEKQFAPATNIIVPTNVGGYTNILWKYESCSAY